MWLWTLLALPAAAQETDSIALPLDGLRGGCCEGPVESALSKIENVVSVKLRESGDLYYADIVMKSGCGLPLSEVKKALDAENGDKNGMAKAMGTKYLVFEKSISLSMVHLFRTKAEPNQTKLEGALKKLSGYKGVAKSRIGFSVIFEGDKQATYEEIKKGCGVEVTDVILAASKEGARYSCPMHPEVASPIPGKCPLCEMALEKVAASSGSKTTSTEETPKPNGGGGKKKG